MVQLLDEFVQVISTKADTRGFDVLDRKQKRAINNTSILSKSFSRMFGFIGGALALNSLKNYADEWTNIESTLRLVSGTEEERLRVEEKLFDISQRTRQSMTSNVDLYRNMTMATEKLNISEENRLKIVETIGKSLAIGGGGSASQQAALVQFGQALSMGRLRAQEMNSIISQTPRLGKALAAGMGMTLKEIIYDIGGGIKNDREFKAVQMGGPSGGCIPASLIDTPVDYENIGKIGAIVGSGGMVVMDETTCMVDMARYFLDFTRKESCGKCNYCRIGTKRMLEILERITDL